MTVSSFIIVVYVWQILERRAFLLPSHPWAVLKWRIRNRVKETIKPPTEIIKKPVVFWCFQGLWKETNVMKRGILLLLKLIIPLLFVIFNLMFRAKLCWKHFMHYIGFSLDCKNLFIYGSSVCYQVNHDYS